ncbi:hypothetical protein T4E_5832 [Trichinella pseudospiralis]|uniref:Uncharacterized protein n=1 Tax=Trichinella pseudospiralis TaxID=6337 RepID=A0A0V0XDP8_TRIPS|nr:hypothetical protein T4E_5832 [Trichinella pseudospiralis]
MPSNPDEGLHLPPLIGAAPLWARERATGVDHRKALFTRLRQHRSDDVLAGVDVHHKGSADVSSTVLGPSSSSHAAGTPHTDKVPDEPSVVGRKSQKLPVEMNFRTVLGHDVPCVSYALPSSLIPSAPSPSGAGKWPERHDLEQSASATSDLPMRRRMDKCAEPPAFPVMCPKCGQCAGWTVRRRM